MMKSLIKILPWIIVIVALLALYQMYVDLSNERKIFQQNEFALKDSLRQLNDSWNSRYAFITKLNSDKDSLLQAKEETILNKTKTILQLKEIISSGYGVVVTDTVELTHIDTVTRHYRFLGQTDFYKYVLNVWSGIKPYHALEMKFSPIKLDLYLTRNKEGIWSGYTKLDNVSQSYLSVSNMNIYVDKDEYVRVEEEKLRVDVGFGLSYLTSNFLLGTASLKVNSHLVMVGYMNNTYLIGYQKMFTIY